MSESKNSNVDKSGNVNNEKVKKEKHPREVIKNMTPPPSFKEGGEVPGPIKIPLEPSKSDRLDRMEKQLNLLEAGILTLIHSTQWHNLSITPVGQHDANTLIDGFTSLQAAVNELSPEDHEQIAQ